MSRESEKKHVEALLHGPGKVPTIQVSGDDFYAIEKALQGYSGYLRSGGKLSSEQQRLILRMQEVQAKLTHNMQQARNGRAITDGLAFEDIEVISEALVGFVHAISRRVPRSSQRDEIVTHLRFLWQRLEKLLDEMATDVR